MPNITNTICKVQKIDAVGDALVVAAARVSFNNDSTSFDDEKDSKLIDYLVKHQHWSPCAHPHMSFVLEYPLPVTILKELVLSPIHGLRWGNSFDSPSGAVDYVSGSYWGLLELHRRYEVEGVLEALWQYAPSLVRSYDTTYDVLPNRPKIEGKFVPCLPLPRDKVTTVRIEAPLAMARQLFKHQVGFTFSERLPWNEVSGRYVDLSKFDYYMPSEFHAQAKNKKQGVDADIIVKEVLPNEYEAVLNNIDDWYNSNSHIGNEERRLLLPACKMTAWYWTAREEDWDRVFALRLDPHAQLGTQEVVRMIKEKVYE